MINNQDLGLPQVSDIQITCPECNIKLEKKRRTIEIGKKKIISIVSVCPKCGGIYSENPEHIKLMKQNG